MDQTLYNDTELKAFARSGVHIEAMKTSSHIAKEIRTITIDADSLPNWKEAKKILEGGKAIKY